PVHHRDDRQQHSNREKSRRADRLRNSASAEKKCDRGNEQRSVLRCRERDIAGYKAHANRENVNWQQCHVARLAAGMATPLVISHTANVSSNTSSGNHTAQVTGEDRENTAVAGALPARRRPAMPATK